MPTKPQQLVMMIVMVSGLLVATGMTCEDPNVPTPVPTPGTEQPGDPNTPTPTPPDGEPAPAPFDITGVWKRVSGDFALASELNGADVEFVALRENGDIEVTMRHQQTQGLFCFTGLFSKVTERSILLDFGLSDLRDAGVFGTSLALHNMPDNDTLEITENGQIESVFERVVEIPVEDTCTPLVVVDELEDLPEPDFPTDLVLINDVFFYSNDDVSRELVRINKNDGSILAPLTINGGIHQHPLTGQGDDLWNHCNCASETLLERVTQASESIDEVTEGELGFADFDVETAAFNEESKLLFIAGRDRIADRRQILVVNAEAEPDVLVNAFDFALRIEEMTMDGPDLLVLAGFPTHVYRIETNTMKVVETFSLPLFVNRDLEGIEVDGDAIFILMERFGAGQAGDSIVELRAAESG